MTPAPCSSPRLGLAALLALTALAGCTGSREGLPSRVPPNPFASNYPSAPPPADAPRARRADGSLAPLPPGRIPE